MNKHVLELMHGSSVAFLLKICAAASVFILNVLIANYLGATDSGLYFLAYTLVFIFASMGRVGFENTITRFVASYHVENEYGKILGAYNFAILVTFVGSFIFSFCLFILSDWISFSIFEKPALSGLLRWMSFFIIPLSVMTIHAHALQGLKKIAASVSTLNVFAPLISCLFIIILVPRFGINGAIAAQFIGVLFAAVFGRYLWNKSVETFPKVVISLETGVILDSCKHLYIVVLMNMIILWSPTLLLGVWESSTNVGVFNAAYRTAFLISFILLAINSIAAPKFASLYKANDLVNLAIVARHAAYLGIALSLPILLIVIAVPELILSIFGNEFISGSSVLIVLAVGQFINVVTGSVGFLLVMSGNERIMQNNLIFCAIIILCLNILFIPRYGILGAAYAASITMICQNIIALYFVRKKLKIDLVFK